MCNNLTFLSNPAKRVQLLIHLTLWTFSVDSYIRGAYIEGTLPPDFLMNTADGEADYFDLLAMTRNLACTL